MINGPNHSCSVELGPKALETHEHEQRHCGSKKKERNFSSSKMAPIKNWL